MRPREWVGNSLPRWRLLNSTALPPASAIRESKLSSRSFTILTIAGRTVSQEVSVVHRFQCKCPLPTVQVVEHDRNKQLLSQGTCLTADRSTRTSTPCLPSTCTFPAAPREKTMTHLSVVESPQISCSPRVLLGASSIPALAQIILAPPLTSLSVAKSGILPSLASGRSKMTTVSGKV